MTATDLWLDNWWTLHWSPAWWAGTENGCWSSCEGWPEESDLFGFRCFRTSAPTCHSERLGSGGYCSGFWSVYEHVQVSCQCLHYTGVTKDWIRTHHLPQSSFGKTVPVRCSYVFRGRLRTREKSHMMNSLANLLHVGAKKPTRRPCSLLRTLCSWADGEAVWSLWRQYDAIRHLKAAAVTDFLHFSCSAGQSASFSVITSASCHLTKQDVDNGQTFTTVAFFVLF